MQDSFQGLIHLGQQWLQEGRYAQASEILSQVVHENAASPEPRYLLAQSLAGLGDWEGAEKQLTRALKFNPRHVGARLLLGSAHLEQRRFKAAKDLLHATFEFERESFELHEMLIQACLGTREYDDAERIARRWVVIAPTVATPYVWLAKILLEQSPDFYDHEPVIDYLETALSIDPANEEAADLLVKVTTKAKGEADGIQLAVKLLPSIPGATRLLLTTADILSGVGQAEQAFHIIKGQLETRPEPEFRKWLSARDYKPRSVSRDSQHVVFVTDYLRSRHLKMASALREQGWMVSALSREMPDYDVSSYFDDVQAYSNPEHALYLASRKSPRVFHIFSTYGDDTACQILKDKPGAVVFEPYDLIEGFYNRPGMEDAIRKQRFCLEHANGITSRDLRARFARRYLDYNLPARILSFPDYCWNKAGEANEKLSGVHIVSNGYFGTSLSDSDTDWGLLELAVGFIQMGFHFHVYPHPSQAQNGAFAPELAQLVILQEKLPQFHLHYPVPANKVVEEYRKYHIGVSAFSQALLNRPVQGYTAAHLRYCTGSRNVDYIDAGLPVLVTPELACQTRMLKRFGLALPIYKHKLSELSKQVAGMLADPELCKRATQAREELAMSRHISRLVNFYESF